MNFFYTCRMCSQSYRSALAATREDAVRVLTDLANDQRLALAPSGDEVQVERQGVHRCEHGGLGIADLIGATEEKRQSARATEAASKSGLIP